MSEKKSEYRNDDPINGKRHSIAAEKNKFELLSKANAFRVIKEKKALSDLDEALAKLTEEEKNI